MNCGLCKKEVHNICIECGTGTDNPSNKFVWVICPNKHVYHSNCLNSWASHDSYCLICKEELLDESCSRCQTSNVWNY